jgi:hypothetical protein
MTQLWLPKTPSGLGKCPPTAHVTMLHTLVHRNPLPNFATDVADSLRFSPPMTFSRTAGCRVARPSTFCGRWFQEPVTWRTAFIALRCTGWTPTRAPCCVPTTPAIPWFPQPAVADGVVYVGSLDDSIYALDARTRGPPVALCHRRLPSLVILSSEWGRARRLLGSQPLRLQPRTRSGANCRSFQMRRLEDVSSRPCLKSSALVATALANE